MLGSDGLLSRRVDGSGALSLRIVALDDVVATMKFTLPDAAAVDTPQPVSQRHVHNRDLTQTPVS